jgi:thiosulfate/3-mercaptopyruvate sulfurtransferase
MRRRSLLLGLGALGLGALGCSRSDGSDSANGKAFPWTPDRLLAPSDLARRLPPATGAPTVLHVGPVSLFEGARVPGAVSVGEGGEARGLAELERRVQPFARDRELVIYCGCCPWKNCPNIRPAFEKLAALHFTNVRVLDLPTTFRAGWSEQGFPVARGT